MLFKKTSEVLEYAEFSAEINFTSIKATIRNVELLHIVPILGKELYGVLNNAYALITNETALSASQKLLLDQCRCVIGPYLCYYYAPKGEVKLSDSGLNRLESGNNKSAYQYQGTNYREANLREGENATEMLMEFLEDNKSSYPEYVASDAFRQYRSLFIKSGKEFQDLFNSHSPYRNYWAMRSKMVDVEENNIRPALGNILFNYLKTIDQSATGIFSLEEQELMFKLKKAIAYFTVSFSIPYLNVRMDANGLTVLSNTGASRDEDAKKIAATDSALSKLITSSFESGQTWLNNATKYLNENFDDFTGWPILVTIPTESINCSPYYNNNCGVCNRRIGTFSCRRTGCRSANNESGGSFGLC